MPAYRPRLSSLISVQRRLAPRWPAAVTGQQEAPPLSGDKLLDLLATNRKGMHLQKHLSFLEYSDSHPLPGAGLSSSA